MGSDPAKDRQMGTWKKLDVMVDSKQRKRASISPNECTYAFLITHLTGGSICTKRDLVSSFAI